METAKKLVFDPNTYVVKKFLRAVPSKFLQIVSTIEQFSDLKTMTVEEVIGCLKTHEERIRGSGDNEDEHVLLTRTEWKAREAKAEGETSSNAKGQGGSGARGLGLGHGLGRSEGDHENDSNHRERKFDKAKVRCYNCQNYGHFASECRSKKKEEKAHFVEKQDDDEPALLMAEACELVQTVDDVSGEVMLNEERVKPRLGTGGQDASGVWYLDTGASNHMTGCRDVFTELDATVKGTVRFGDNSVVDICGCGTILFQCQAMEHKVLTDVYYIPRLRSNIVSLGQLDEHGCKTVMEDGQLCIFDRQRILLAKVRR